MTAKNQKQQKPPQQSKQNEGKAGEVETAAEVVDRYLVNRNTSQ